MWVASNTTLRFITVQTEAGRVCGPQRAWHNIGVLSTEACGIAGALPQWQTDKAQLGQAVVTVTGLSSAELTRSGLVLWA